MYFDEDLVLDIRLNTLNNEVSKFIIVEATKNHAGKDKKLNFKIENFSKFKDKIELSIKLNTVLEKMIHKNPEQWIWSHNRWK